ncbi:MAG: hypothetical protein PUC44_01865 [Eubacteriales bacterium]|nr:hypothetical protein [Eubacteriales bacterium]
MQGQVPRFFVSAAEGKDEFPIRKFREFLKAHIDSNKVPKIVDIIDEIPRAENGKIQRGKLRSLAASGRK